MLGGRRRHETPTRWIPRARSRLASTRWLVAATCILALSGCDRLEALAPGDGGAAPSGSSPSGVMVGREARTSLYTMTVKSVLDCPPTAFEEPGKGHIWLGIDVEIEALTSNPVPANPFRALLIDADGRHYRARFDGCKPALRHPPVSRGATARGLITFEIGERASGLVLRYDPHMPGHPHQEVRFDLGR